MTIKKERVIIVIFAIILIIITVAVIFFALSPREKTEEIATPTPIPESATSIEPTPLPIEAKTNPPIQYDQDSARKMLDKLNNKTTLSQNDTEAREKLLSLLPAGQVSGVLYRSPTIIIDYTNAADQFQAEIITVDIAQAKADATAWLKSQGLSQQGICDLPVVFYLSRNVLGQLRDKNYTFSPLAEGC
ncbi:MAG TPA: hypothetical protein VM077_04540 [Candidatus Limnocylindrales bacterium]|nr:hypothetical protein [Candidatus Limnocylindrales bacterium]